MKGEGKGRTGACEREELTELATEEDPSRRWPFEKIQKAIRIWAVEVKKARKAKQEEPDWTPDDWEQLSPYEKQAWRAAIIDWRAAEFRESNNPGYTGGMDAAERIQAAAELLSSVYPAERVGKALEDLAANASRETTSRSAKEQPRLKWETDRDADEDPAHFAARAYRVEMQAETLHRGLIGQEDPALRTKLNNWERTHPWPEKWPADVPYIPTKPEWNTAQLAKLGRPPKAPKRPRIASEEGRLYEVENQRRVRVSGLT